MRTQLHEGVAAISTMIADEPVGKRLVLRVVSKSDGAVIDIDLHDVGVALKKRCPSLFELTAQDMRRMTRVRAQRERVRA